MESFHGFQRSTGQEKSQLMNLNSSVRTECELLLGPMEPWVLYIFEDLRLLDYICCARQPLLVKSFGIAAVILNLIWRQSMVWLWHTLSRARNKHDGCAIEIWKSQRWSRNKNNKHLNVARTNTRSELSTTTRKAETRLLFDDECRIICRS